MRMTVAGKMVCAIASLSFFVCTDVMAAAPYLPSGRILPYFTLDGSLDSGRWTIKDTSGVRYSMNAPGTTAGASFGLGAVLGPVFWLALEAGGEYNSTHTSTVQINTVNGSSNSKYRMLYGFTLSLVPGIRFGNASRFLLYGRIGVIESRYKIWQGLVSPVDATAVDRPLEWGQVYGGGIQALIWRDWSARAEYDRIVYNSFTSSFGSRINANENRYRLGLVYSFV